MGNVIYYYAAGNTSKGFRPLYKSMLKRVKDVYLLEGGSDKFKSEFFKELIKKYEGSLNLEVILSTLCEDEIEGIILKDKDIAIINKTPLHGAMDFEGDNSEVINLNIFFKEEIKDRIYDLSLLKREFKECMEKATKEFYKALEIHDKWEGIYFPYLNKEKADDFTKCIIEILKERGEKIDRQGEEVERYLGGATPKGAKDSVPSITYGLKRYFLKGRAGTGKSTMLKKISKAIRDFGYDVEVYNCGFDPDSKDMVICRDLNFAIFDSTAPHEYFPSLKEDEVIDVYNIYIDEDVDKIYKDEIKEVSLKYKKQIEKGTEFLKRGEEIKKIIDEIYYKAFDFEKCKEALGMFF